MEQPPTKYARTRVYWGELWIRGGGFVQRTSRLWPGEPQERGRDLNPRPSGYRAEARPGAYRQVPVGRQTTHRLEPSAWLTLRQRPSIVWIRWSGDTSYRRGHRIKSAPIRRRAGHLAESARWKTHGAHDRLVEADAILVSGLTWRCHVERMVRGHRMTHDVPTKRCLTRGGRDSTLGALTSPRR